MFSKWTLLALNTHTAGLTNEIQTNMVKRTIHLYVYLHMSVLECFLNEFIVSMVNSTTLTNHDYSSDVSR